MLNRRDNTVLNRSASAPNEGRPPVWNTGGQDQGKWVDPQRPEHGRSFQRQNLGPTIDRSQPLGPQGQEETRSKDQLFESQGSTAGSFDEFWGGVIKGREGRAQEKLELDQSRLGFDEKKEANRQLEWGLGHSREANRYEDERADKQHDRDMAQSDTLVGAAMSALSGGSEAAQARLGEVMGNPEQKKEMMGLLDNAMKIIDKGTTGQEAIEQLAPLLAGLSALTGLGQAGGSPADPLDTFKNTESFFDVLISSGKVNRAAAEQVLNSLKKDADRKHAEWRKDRMTEMASASAKDVQWQDEGGRRADQARAASSAANRQTGPGGATYGATPPDARWTNVPGEPGYRPVPADDPRKAARKRPQGAMGNKPIAGEPAPKKPWWQGHRGENTPSWW